MERLTERFEGWVMRKGCHGPCRTCNRVECKDIYSMIDRLTAYEDTGLEPESIDVLKKREQGLAELLTDISCGCTVTYGRLAELAQAEKDGRLVVLPCKVGDTLSIISNEIIEETKVRTFFLGHPSHNIEKRKMRMIRTTKWDIPMEEIGKRIFFTREEAEAALKKREEEDNEAD